MSVKKPGRRPKPPKSVVGEGSERGDMRWMLMLFLEWMAVHNYSNRTIEDRRKDVLAFIAWSEERGVYRPGEVSKPVLERYQKHLYHYRQKSGRPLSFRSQRGRLGSVQAYFKYLSRENHILYNPASELILPRAEKRLPRFVLSSSEVEQILNQTNVRDVCGIRDRAILEVLYSSGIRRMEVINISIYDVDVERGTLFVHQGKGKKDRVVPLGERAISWLEKYLSESRPKLAIEPDDGTLFLASHGEGLTLNRLSRLVRSYIDAAEVKKPGACHLFRHSMATLMLENGADIRFIQEILGHANVSTTQIYTHIAIQKLQEIHRATHPAGLKTGATDKQKQAEALLSTLAAEESEEEADKE